MDAAAADALGQLDARGYEAQLLEAGVPRAKIHKAALVLRGREVLVVPAWPAHLLAQQDGAAPCECSARSTLSRRGSAHCTGFRRMPAAKNCSRGFKAWSDAPVHTFPVHGEKRSTLASQEVLEKRCGSRSYVPRLRGTAKTYGQHGGGMARQSGRDCASARRVPRRTTKWPQATLPSTYSGGDGVGQAAADTAFGSGCCRKWAAKATPRALGGSFRPGRRSRYNDPDVPVALPRRWCPLLGAPNPVCRHGPVPHHFRHGIGETGIRESEARAQQAGRPGQIGRLDRRQSGASSARGAAQL